MRLYEEDFWGRVRARCSMMRMTVKELCSRVGMPYRTATNQISLGKMPTDRTLIERIAKELGCSERYLIEGMTDSEPTVTQTRDIQELIFHYQFLSPDKKKLLMTVAKALDDQQQEEDHSL